MATGNESERIYIDPISWFNSSPLCACLKSSQPRSKIICFLWWSSGVVHVAVDGVIVHHHCFTFVILFLWDVYQHLNILTSIIQLYYTNNIFITKFNISILKPRLPSALLSLSFVMSWLPGTAFHFLNFDFKIRKYKYLRLIIFISLLSQYDHLFNACYFI